jgi:hypothetical protein
MASRVLAFLRDERNRAILGWIGGGTAVRADREARFFTICSSYAPILNQRREISR